MKKTARVGGIEYVVEETSFGVWRRYSRQNGRDYAEFTSHTQIFSLPLVHYTRGVCPETGRRRVATGFLAVGRIARGVIALGQVSMGFIAIGQASLGILLSLAQVGGALFAAGQVALGVVFGAGQGAIGLTAIGQAACGQYVLAMAGLGQYLWTLDRADPEAVQHFEALWDFFSGFGSAR